MTSVCDDKCSLLPLGLYQRSAPSSSPQHVFGTDKISSFSISSRCHLGACPGFIASRCQFPMSCPVNPPVNVSAAALLPPCCLLSDYHSPYENRARLSSTQTVSSHGGPNKTDFVVAEFQSRSCRRRCRYYEPS